MKFITNSATSRKTFSYATVFILTVIYGCMVKLKKIYNNKQSFNVSNRVITPVSDYNCVRKEKLRLEMKSSEGVLRLTS